MERAAFADATKTAFGDDDALTAYACHLFDSGRVVEGWSAADVTGALARAADGLAGKSDAAKLCQVKMVLCAGGYKDDVAIRAFLSNHGAVEGGNAGTIGEAEITPAKDLPAYASLPASADLALVKETVVMKLNGGLGTGMGLSKAKSLLPVKSGKTFLDYIAQQVLHFRAETKSNVRFMLMDSFSTSDDTKAFFTQAYPELAAVFNSEIEVMQGRVPKIGQDGLRPAEHDADKENEWCPPGHGELYAALYSSGKLAELVSAGYKYLFVSNSDNLGATLDTTLLAHLAGSDNQFMMEVCERTESDKKGGHLAQKGDRLILRESAQCPKEDEAAFQDVGKHRYFNTNNLWLKLPDLQAALDAARGALPLPPIRNGKTVNPTDGASEKVFQLETAMGTAIALFPKATAVVVPRSRFAPVKTCADLLNLRSDCYEETADKRLQLCAARQGVPPVVSLEDKHYKFVDQFEQLVAAGVPSLVECDKVTVKGPISFAAGVVLKGTVTITNASDDRKTLAAGEYSGEVTL